MSPEQPARLREAESEAEALQQKTNRLAVGMLAVFVLFVGVAIWVSLLNGRVTRIEASPCQRAPSSAACSRLRHKVSHAQVVKCEHHPHSHSCIRAIEVACDNFKLADVRCPAIHERQHQRRRPARSHRAPHAAPAAPTGSGGAVAPASAPQAPAPAPAPTPAPAPALSPSPSPGGGGSGGGSGGGGGTGGGGGPGGGGGGPPPPNPPPILDTCQLHPTLPVCVSVGQSGGGLHLGIHGVTGPGGLLP